MAQVITDGASPDPTRLFEHFLPPHQTGPNDPFAAGEALLGRIAKFGQRVTLVALPTFLWFATRTFASMRTALNDVYDVSLRPRPSRHFLLGFLYGKLRDLTMVVMVLLLFLTSTAISTGLVLLQAWGEVRVPEFSFWFGTAGRVLGEVVAFGFILILFFFLFRFASPRKIRWSAALVASLFSATAFEVARRLFAFYVVNVATWNRTSDAQLGAIILCIVWVYYSALVFLLGGVVAETWEMRRLLRRHRVVVAT